MSTCDFCATQPAVPFDECKHRFCELCMEAVIENNKCPLCEPSQNDALPANHVEGADDVSEDISEDIGEDISEDIGEDIGEDIEVTLIPAMEKVSIKEDLSDTLSSTDDDIDQKESDGLHRKEDLIFDLKTNNLIDELIREAEQKGDHLNQESSEVHDEKLEFITKRVMHCYKCQLSTIGLLYCENCDCYLCDSCWDEVHTFYPLKLHVQFRNMNCLNEKGRCMINMVCVDESCTLATKVCCEKCLGISGHDHHKLSDVYQLFLQKKEDIVALNAKLVPFLVRITSIYDDLLLKSVKLYEIYTYTLRQKILTNGDFKKKDYEAVSQMSTYIESLGDLIIEGKQIHLEMTNLINSSNGYHNKIALATALTERYERFYLEACDKIIILEKN